MGNTSDESGNQSGESPAPIQYASISTDSRRGRSPNREQAYRLGRTTGIGLSIFGAIIGGMGLIAAANSRSSSGLVILGALIMVAAFMLPGLGLAFTAKPIREGSNG